jgi:hypothetical protein
VSKSKDAELEPVWHSENVARAPDWWRWRIGMLWDGEGDESRATALGMAEWAVMGQLRSIGIRAAEFRRPDGTVRKVEMK